MANLLNELNLAKIPYINKESKEIDQHSPEAFRYRLITMSIIAVVILPLNLQKRLTTLRYFSVFIFVVVFSTIIISFCQTPMYYNHFKNQPNYKIEWVVAPFKIKWLQGFSTMMLSYNCIITFFYVRGEMRHKSRERVEKVIKSLLILEASFYVIIAVAGYMSLGDNMIPHVFTLRKKLSKTCLVNRTQRLKALTLL